MSEEDLQANERKVLTFLESRKGDWQKRADVQDGAGLTLHQANVALVALRERGAIQSEQRANHIRAPYFYRAA